MTTIQNETYNGLAELLDLEPNLEGTGINTLVQNDHRYLKDLKINVSNVLSYPNLSRKEAGFIAMAVAGNEKNERLIQSFRKVVLEEGAGENEIAEVFACVSLMNTNNVFYRFRHFTNKEFYNQTPAGIKMSIMVNPVLGKEFFELLSLAISAVNGCELCVTSHEESVIKHGASQQRVYDAVRLAAVIKGLEVLI